MPASALVGTSYHTGGSLLWLSFSRVDSVGVACGVEIALAPRKVIFPT
jgi:hypothetical protein